MSARFRNLVSLAAAVLLAVAASIFIAGCGKDDSAGTETAEVDISGPLPKIATDEPKFLFGTMAAGSEKKHQFVIRNDGDAPLNISKLDLACKCTKGSFAKPWLQPGETTTVDVTWRPEHADPNFQQVLELTTNDPRWPETNKFKLTIRGAVDQVVNIDPQREFKVGAIVEDQPTVRHGTVFSRILDKFEILELVTKNKLLTAVAKPLDQAALAGLKAKCGYDVEITLAPGIQIGTFNESITVKTDINGGTDLPWELSGERYGPFRILGTGWIPKHMLVDMGQFNAAQGDKAELKMFVSGIKDGSELQFLEVRSDVPFVTLKMTPSPANASRVEKMYTLNFEVAPGNPPATFAGPKYVKIRVKTNHPKAEEMEFQVKFVSL